MPRRLLLCLAATTGLISNLHHAAIAAETPPRRIVLLAGKKSHGPEGNRIHDYPWSAKLLKVMLERSNVRERVRVDVFRDGWPGDARALEQADCLMILSDGRDGDKYSEALHLENEERVAFVGRQMRRGCGLVTFHFSTFTPDKFGEPVLDWTGGYFDWEEAGQRKWHSAITTLEAEVQPASPGHAIARGVAAFRMKEEFYFNMRFRPGDARWRPLLAVPALGGREPHGNVVAWCVERADGGRGFGTTCGHFYDNWKNDGFRRFMLNAIAWTAKVDVPPGGVEARYFEHEEITRALEAGAKTAESAARPVATAASDRPERQGEKDWVDGRWQQTDMGPWLASSLSTPGGIVARGLSIRLGDEGGAALCFDTAGLSVRGGWTGGLLKPDAARYGLLKPIKPDGPWAFHAPRGAAWNTTNLQWEGYSVNGSRVVLRYRVSGTSVRESPWAETVEGAALFSRVLEIDPAEDELRLNLMAVEGTAQPVAAGGAPVPVVEKDGLAWAVAVLGDASARIVHEKDAFVAVFPPARELRRCKLVYFAGVKEGANGFQQALARVSPAENLDALARPGPGRWQPLTTRGQPGFGAGPYVIDTLTMPYDNPWKALLFCAGVDFLPDGRAAVCTIHGDVWLVSGVDATLEKLTWTRFATGLYQPLGLRVARGKVHVLGRDRITVLHDDNDDGEVDRYESFTELIETSAGGHDYVTSLELDDAGNFYYVDTKGAHRLSADGRRKELIAGGYRHPNGMGVSRDGRIVTVAPQQGEWTPSSALFEVRPGGWGGYGGPRVTDARPLGYDAPFCWIPHAADNSGGSQIWTPAGWGPVGGQLLHFSYGRCSMLLVLRDEVDGIAQGAVAPLPGRFLSGASRGAFHARDGHLYVAGTRGWQTSAVRDGSLQRVRWTGRSACLPAAWQARTGRLTLTFTEPIDPDTAADAGSFALRHWNYRYASSYGSKDWSVADPKKEGRDSVEIQSARLSADGKTVELTVPGLREVMQFELKYNLRSAAGAEVRSEIYGSINRLGPTAASAGSGK